MGSPEAEITNQCGERNDGGQWIGGGLVCYVVHADRGEASDIQICKMYFLIFFLSMRWVLLSYFFFFLAYQTQQTVMHSAMVCWTGNFARLKVENVESFTLK